MKNIVKARIFELLAHGLTWLFGIAACFMLFFNFLKNSYYFDSHYSTAGQYPEGLFWDIVLIPCILVVAAFFAWGIKFLCRKWFLYERYIEKKRR